MTLEKLGERVSWIDGKSLMGLMTLKIGEKMQLVVNGEDEELSEHFFREYEVDEMYDAGRLEERAYGQAGEQLMIGLGTFINSVSIIAGGLIGHFAGRLLKPDGIERGFERLGEWLKYKSGNGRDPGFTDLFVTASLTGMH